MKKIASDGEAYKIDASGEIWTAGIDDLEHPTQKHWSSRIECHGTSKEEAEELRDRVLRLMGSEPTSGN